MSEKYAELMDFMNNVEDFGTYNGIKLTAIEDDFAECRVELTSASLNARGAGHGSLAFAMANIAADFAISSAFRPISASNASISYLRPIGGKYLRAVGIPLKIGKKLAVAEGSVYDDRDVLVAKATFTFCFTD